tara:strand:- start:666 stop:824 length:159 start_codon:yes stop_codon:yes gene_type:complete
MAINELPKCLLPRDAVTGKQAVWTMNLVVLAMTALFLAILMILQTIDLFYFV